METEACRPTWSMRGMCREHRGFRSREEGEELELEGGAVVCLRGRGRKARKHSARLDRSNPSDCRTGKRGGVVIRVEWLVEVLCSQKPEVTEGWFPAVVGPQSGSEGSTANSKGDCTVTLSEPRFIVHPSEFLFSF